ncbi:MAG: alpha/beta fold hydrolase [Cocleimonas sp.]|nr:alpha/beta fold hydrolase [Cocleimonas sp.]
MPLLHYKIYPTKEKRVQGHPLIILHGLLGSMDNWHSQALRLSISRPVITVDLRNHGRSPHLKGMSYKAMVADLLTLLIHEQLTHVDLLGHSMGGKVAMLLTLQHARLINKLIVVDIAPKTYPLWHQHILSTLLQTPLSTFQSRSAIDHYLSQQITDPKKRIFLTKNIQRKTTGGYQWRCNLSEIAKGYLNIAGFPQQHLSVATPSYFIRGEQSHYISPEDTPLIQSMFKHAQQQTVHHAGHLPHIEQADIFYRSVQAFL